MARLSHVSVTLSLLLLTHCPGDDPAPSVSLPDAMATTDSDAASGGDRGLSTPEAGPLDILGGPDAVADAGLPDVLPPRDMVATPDATPPDADVEVDAPPPPPVPPCGAAPTSLVTPAAIQAPDSGSDAWVAPGQAVTGTLESAVTAWFAGDKGTAMTTASSIGYSVCAEGAVSLWQPAAGSGRAWFLLREGAARSTTLATPHPWFEFLVLDQTLALFDALGARAAVVAGTHRCTSPQPGSCSGSSSVCTGASAPFRVSDQAHSVEGTFQAVHRALFTTFPDDVMVSIHGMGSPGVSISNGRTGDAPAGDVAAALAATLANELPGEYVTSCSTNAAVPYDARLCGTTNSQGRLVNGSPELMRHSRDSRLRSFCPS